MVVDRDAAEVAVFPFDAAELGHQALRRVHDLGADPVAGQCGDVRCFAHWRERLAATVKKLFAATVRNRDLAS